MSGIFDQVINYAPPSLLLGTVTYKGTWSAATNTPTLPNPPSSITNGNYYVVSAAGTQFSLVFNIGDWIISNGSAWEKVDNTDAVSSVFGRTGAVVGVSTDYSSVGITATAVGASSPSTGAFTTLSSTSTTTLNSTTIPASKTLVVTTDKISVLAATTSAELAGVISDETGSGSLVFATLPTFGATGVKLSGSTSGTTTVLSGATAGTSVLTLPVATDTLVGKATTDTLTNKTLTSPTITGGALNGTLGATTPSSVAATTGTFSSTLGVTGVATLGNGAILGTPASGTVTNLTGTASININGTVGATTRNTVAATTLDASRGSSGTVLNLLSGNSANYVDISIGRTAQEWFLGLSAAANNYATGTVAGDLVFGASGAANLFFGINNSVVGKLTSTGLNSTAIGATTPSTGAFTTLTSNNHVSTANATYTLGTSGNKWLTAFIQTISDGATASGALLDTTGTTVLHGKGTDWTIHRFYSSGNEIANISSTGAAITGTLSATDTISTTKAVASAGNIVSIKNSTDTGGDNTRYAGVNFLVGSDDGTSSIRSYRTNSATNYETALAFLTNPSGATQIPTEKMRITSTGLVGIGTASPTGKLQVNASSGAMAAYFYTNENSSVSDGHVYINSNETAAPFTALKVRQAGTGPIFLLTGTAAAGEVMRVTSAGLVGIGTASPAVKLDVSGQIRSNSNTLINLTAATTTTLVSIDKVLETDTLANSIVMVTVSGSDGIDAGYNGYFILNLNKNFSNYVVTVISSGLPHNSSGYSFTFSLTSANFQVTAGKTTSFNYNYSVLTGSRTG